MPELEEYTKTHHITNVAVSDDINAAPDKFLALVKADATPTIRDVRLDRVVKVFIDPEE